VRLACCCLLLASVAGAQEGTRLGTLIRWYLKEESPARRQDFLEAIERLAKGDPAVVAAAIRRGDHWDHAAQPVLQQGGALPKFDLKRPRPANVAACAGDFARLVLPEGYDPARAWPLILELSPTGLEPFPGSVTVQVNLKAHPQAATEERAADLLVVSLLAHLFDVVHVDPDRVFLFGGDRAGAALAWYVALHNPDRFAGVLGALGCWPKGAALATNAATFSGLGIESYRGDRALEMFFKALREAGPGHRLLRARETKTDNNTVLRPLIEKWWEDTVRAGAPDHLALVADQGMAVRSSWLRVAPRGHQVTALPATCTAVIRAGNLVEVTTDRVAAFDLFVDPRLLDPSQVLRVQVNGRVPEARVIHLEVADLLEDYRERRDPGRLYGCRLTFPG